MSRLSAGFIPGMIFTLVIALSSAAWSMGPPKGAAGEDRMMGQMLDKLQLSDTQRTQIDAILAGSREEADADHERLRELHESLKAQRQDFDAGTARKLSDELGELMARGAYRKTSTFAEVYELLDSEQQARMDGMLDGLEQRMQEHHGKRRPNPGDA